MNIRFMGSADLITQLQRALETAGIEARIYPNRVGAEFRLYATVDDRRVEEILTRVGSLAPSPPDGGRGGKRKKLSRAAS